MEPRHFKITIVGSGSVGKTALASRFTKDLFLDGEFKTEIMQMPLSKKIEVDGIPVVLEIHHYIPPEDWSTRELLLRKSDGFLVVYSLIAMSTFNDVPDLFESVLRCQDRDDVPLIIVGNKLDLCNDEDSEHNIRVVTTDQGQQMARGTGRLRFGFFEVSAKTNFNVNDLFIELVHRIIEDKKAHNNSSGIKKKKKSECNTH